MSDSLRNLAVLDRITTVSGKTYTVQEIVPDDEGGRQWVLPAGGDEYTYLIPVENITHINGVPVQHE